VPLPTVVRSTDLEVLARGKHLAESVAPCATRDCHGTDLGGGRPIEVGPIGVFCGPNLTQSMALYSDAELARLIRHGLKRDGRSVAFMTVQDFRWLPDDDIAAVISYLRTQPPVDRPSGQTVIKTLGKILDRQDKMILDIARHIDHSDTVRPKGATPTVEYGQYLGMACTGCHGEHLSGGKIPGTPSSIPIPLNLTPHESGIKDWELTDFNRLLDTGVRKNGKTLNPFMPVAAFAKYDDVERQALWSYLRSVPPMPFGQR
jgi:hypothetical protein